MLKMIICHHTLALLLLITGFISYVVVVEAQVPTLPWNNLIFVGQSNSTSKVSGSSTNRLNLPTSLAIIGDSLVVSDYNNQRIVTYNLSSISTFANYTSVLNFSRGVPVKANGVEGYIEAGTQYIWLGTVGDKSKNTLDNVSRYSFPFTSSNQDPDANVTFTGGVTFSTVQSVKVDVVNQLLYVIDSGNNRILQYSASDLSRPLRIYGQTTNSLNATRANQGTTPSARTLYNPTKVVLGCNNDLFIVDARNNRVLRFANNNIVANAVIGQPNFNSVSSSSLPSRLNTPYSAAINSGCSDLWVADTLNNRVLKFDLTNLTSGAATTAVGQLGDPSNTGPNENRFRPYDIEIERKSGRLWIADAINNRVIGGVSCGVDQYVINKPSDYNVCIPANWTVCGACDANNC